MVDETLKQKVLALAEPVVTALGLAIWGLDIVQGPVTRVCLYIDLPLEDSSPINGNLSASIEHCEEVSRQLGLALEVEDLFQGRWLLEVSSPGLERKFFKPRQMIPYVGDLVECSVLEEIPGFENRKNFRGKLLEADEEFFAIAPCAISGEGEIFMENLPPVRISWQNLRYARRVHIFSNPSKPGKPGKKSRKNNDQIK